MNSKEALEELKNNFGLGVIGKSLCNIISQDIERLEKYKKAIKILKNKLELPLENDFDVVDKNDILLYRLRIKALINEQEYELLKEVLGNE